MTIPSNLSPRGWAALVLAVGFALAVPFFKGTSDQKQYQTVADKPFRPSPVQSRPANPTNQPDYSSSPSSITASAVPSFSTKDNSQKIVDAVQSSGSAVSTSESRYLVSPRGSSQSQSNEPKLVNSLDKIRPPENVDELPRPALPAQAENVVGHSSPVVQPSFNDWTGTAPSTNELPDWAKKPSLLDSLIKSKQPVLGPSKESTKDETPTARKPSEFKTWAEDFSSRSESSATTATDRYSPFGSSEIAQQRPETSSTARLSKPQMVWPDEDPRMAVKIEPPARIVGRDAIIRDPAKLENITTPSRTPAVLSATIGNGASMGSNHGGSASPQILTQPKFGQPQSGAQRPGIGPPLRSYLPPDESQFIQQPSFKFGDSPK